MSSGSIRLTNDDVTDLYKIACRSAPRSLVLPMTGAPAVAQNRAPVQQVSLSSGYAAESDAGHTAAQSTWATIY